MPLGRPRAPGTEAERAEARRAKVRLNVQNFRRRQKERDQQQAATRNIANESTEADTPSNSSTRGLDTSISKLAGPLSTLAAASSPKADKWSIDLPMQFELSGAYSDAFRSALQYRYEPAVAKVTEVNNDSNIRVAICCATWVTSACLRVGQPGTEMVSDALLASALNIISKERDDPEMALHGVQIHTKALNRLREAFDRFTRGDKTIDPATLSLAALTCAMSELLANKSWANFAKHLTGVGALIQHSGPEALTCSVTRDHFYGYRAIQAAFSFTNRQGSFLAKQEWIDFPWKHQHALANHPLHTLLDVAYRIPVEMQDHDTSVLNSPLELTERIRRLRKISVQLDRWKMETDFSYQDQTLYTLKPARWKGLHTHSIAFGNLTVASAFTFYTGVRIQLLNLIKDVADELAVFEKSAIETSATALKESLMWSRLACQCLEFFHATDAKIVGRLVCLFPFDSAWETFGRLHRDGSMDLTRELTWCHQSAERFTAMGLPVLSLR